MIDYQMISAGGVICSILFSVFAIVRSSKQKATDTMDKIASNLNCHILEDAKIQEQLLTNVQNIKDQQDKFDVKIDKIIEVVHK